MAQQPNQNELAREKRDLARRARRLAQTQFLDADRARLTQFADELDKEAEGLERRTHVILMPPVAAPMQHEQQQVQEQLAEQAKAPKATD
jgi:hypothetical protein